MVTTVGVNEASIRQLCRRVGPFSLQQGERGRGERVSRQKSGIDASYRQGEMRRESEREGESKQAKEQYRRLLQAGRGAEKDTHTHTHTQRERERERERESRQKSAIDASYRQERERTRERKRESKQAKEPY